MTHRTYTKRITWTPAMIETLIALYPSTKASIIAEMLGANPGQIYSQAKKLGLHKTREAIAEMTRVAMANTDHPGRGTQFAKGGTPWNKGTKYIAGGRSEQTQFKKGTVAHNWMPIGTERIRHDGYRERKVSDTGVTRRDYVCIHHLVWKEAGLEIPPGYALSFKDKSKIGNADISTDDLELITRAELMRRNSVHNYGPEIARLKQLQGAITRQINKREGKHA